MRRQTVLQQTYTVISYLFLALMVIITILPLGWILSTSFKGTAEIYADIPRWIPQYPTLENYVDVFFHSSLSIGFLNSIIIALISSFLALFIGGSAGYAYARFKFRGDKFMSIFTLTSQMLPLTVLMIPLYYMENTMGLIDTKFGVSIAHLVISLPLVTWMVKGYVDGVPRELEEAAIIDGCSLFGAVARVVLPVVRPALAATFIYAFISSCNDFTLAIVLTRTVKSRTVTFLLNEFSSYVDVNWGSIMAASAVIALPVIVVFMAVQRHFVSGLASGSIKG